MVALKIELEGDGIYPDLIGQEHRIIHLGNDAPPIGISGLPGGMTSGKPSVMLRIDLPDGRVVMAETTLRLLLTAADAFRTHYGDPRTNA
jgi:hypothetical protein